MRRTPRVRFVAPEMTGKTIAGAESDKIVYSSGRESVTGTKLGVVGLVILLAWCLAVAGCGGGGENTKAVGAQETSEAQSAAKPEVAVVIEAYYPMNPSHQFIADYLKSVEAANPGNVSLAVYDMQSAEGREKWSKTGLTCAGVFVNGSTRHEIDRDGTPETVDFLQRMDVFWSKDDFETVMAQELEKAGATFVAPPREAEASEEEGEAAEESAASED